MARTRGRVLWGIAIGVILIVAASVAVIMLRPDPEPEIEPVTVSVPIEITDVSIPDGSSIGIVLTHGSAEGSQWGQAAQGAVVAHQRLARDGVDLPLVVESDSGTVDGALRAISTLVDQGVSGIVYASSGEHVIEALESLELEVPVILPYQSAPLGAANVWSLAPTDAAVAGSFDDALESYENPLYLNAGNAIPGGDDEENVIEYDVSGIGDVATDVALLVGANPNAYGTYTGDEDDDGDDAQASEITQVHDVIVVGGDAVQLAHAGYELQSRDVGVPILLGPDAVSPAFASTLRSLGGTVAPNWRTVGADWSDAVALETSDEGRAMSAFLAAIRQFASDDELNNLTEDALFSTVANSADVRSHDAVVILARAIDAAQGGSANDVAGAVAGLSLGAADGIAGPHPDLSSPDSLTHSVLLYASNQKLGLRSGSDESEEALFWSPVPPTH